MLFNSFEFIFLFWPITLIGFFALARYVPTYRYLCSKLYLLVASLFFYGWWNPANLPLIAISIGCNYGIGSWLARANAPQSLKRTMLALGVAANLGLIFYYKYAGFFVATVNHLTDLDFNLGNIVLPLAISFFTLQQIAYLVDTYKGKAQASDLLSYCLFVCFFPQLIAGPIVHHNEIIQQFQRPSTYRFDPLKLSVGCFIFSLGLFKKAVLADRIAEFAELVFDAAAQGIPLSFFEAWVGALSYSIQLYLDFSGYTDMALGIAYSLGIYLPLNFNSPYKASSIIEFWRRWHITLSNFLRDYLYIPLGGSRLSLRRRDLNLFLTLLLGGLWHGAAWNFVIWGGLQGIYLIINHRWRQCCQQLKMQFKQFSPLSFRWLSWVITFLTILISWVLFRAKNLSTGLTIIGTMFGSQGISLPTQLNQVALLTSLENIGVKFDGLHNILHFSIDESVQLLISFWAVALLAPNTQQWMQQYWYRNEQSCDRSPILQRLSWQPTIAWSLLGAVIFSTGILHINRISEFLYFEF